MIIFKCNIINILTYSFGTKDHFIDPRNLKKSGVSVTGIPVYLLLSS